MRLRPSRTSALLGPTNTGKTYRAIQQMLEHPSGMFGLPLRLLAREVYERVVAATGPDQVALVTGEEKIIPKQPRYFICTVEAMPLDRRVAFVAIDEIQLAANRQRGHVFTDRLLNCRGLEQTVFLGSDTIQGLLVELVPGIEVERAERFSTLSLAGPHRIQNLPKRSAIVAFSRERVYELAEAVKSLHGGTAVVLGALSPRTRNAQVEMYQSGHVNHLVATDAIGMGLNLDLHHVAMESVSKFDGRSFRPLTASEVGQIAGRAGRYKTDGTFGSLRPLELEPELVAAVQQHRFPRVRRLFWRNTQLDFDSIEDLLQTLERPAPHPALIAVRGEDDQHVLATLQRDPEVVRRVTSPAHVQRLWDICRVPDFRKTLTDAHVRLLRDLALHLLGDRGALPDHWIEERLSRLDRVDGDIGTLMARIAWVRTWTYITYRGDWVASPAHWQAKTRAIDDRLSDALHDALTARFVDRRAMHVQTAGPVTVEGQDVHLDGLLLGRIAALEFEPVPGITRAGLNRARTALRDTVREAVSALVTCPDNDLSLDDDHQVLWNASVLASLKQGPDLFEPKIVLRRFDLLEGAEKDQVRTRVERWVRDTVRRLLQPVRGKAPLSPSLRGIVYAVERGMGTVPRAEVAAAVDGLTPDDKRTLARRGIRIGRHSLYIPSTLKPAMVRIRARLLSIASAWVPTRLAPPPSTTAVAGVDEPGFWWKIGFPVVGGVAVRADVLETCAAELRAAARPGAFDLPASVVSRLALSEDAARSLVRGLGYVPAGGRFIATRGKGRQDRSR